MGLSEPGIHGDRCSTRPWPKSARSEVGFAANAAQIAKAAAVATVTLRRCMARYPNRALCGGRVGGRSNAAAWGGRVGGKSDAAAWGGRVGGKSNAAAWGGRVGGRSNAPAWGGRVGGKSNAPAWGGRVGGKSSTVACGGSVGGKSKAAKAELATAQPATKAIRLTFI